MGMDAAPLVSLAGGAAGTAASSALGGGSSGGSAANPYTIPPFVGQMNNMLQQSLVSANADMQSGTNSAISQQNTSLAAANQALSQGVTNANNQATTTSNSGLNQYMSLNAPLAQTAYQGLDAYADSLGLQRPTIGSGAVANALFNTTQAQTNLSNLGQPIANPGAAPASYTPTTQDQAFQWMLQNPTQYSQYVNSATPEQAYVSQDPNGLVQASQGILNNTPGQQSALSAVNSYNNNANLFNTYQQQAGQAVSGVSPQQVSIANAYKNGLFS